MCLFVFVGFFERAHQEARTLAAAGKVSIRASFAFRYLAHAKVESAAVQGFQVSPNRNSSIRALFSPRSSIFEVTTGVCSCGLDAKEGTAAASFRNAILDIVARCGRLDVFAHNFHGDVASEKVGPTTHVKLTQHQYLEQGFGCVCDTLLSIRRPDRL